MSKLVAHKSHADLIPAVVPYDCSTASVPLERFFVCRSLQPATFHVRGFKAQIPRTLQFEA